MLARLSTVCGLAEVIRAAVDQVDAGLVGRVGPEYVAHARATLAALIEGSRGADHGHGPDHGHGADSGHGAAGHHD